ncbi:hypothetical protein ABEF95_012786 [Exophiala dermatitidis]
MSLGQHQLEADTGSPMRPGSSWTANSFFADSAISVRTRTPGPLEKETNPFDTYAATEQPGLADRLEGLVAEIWASEQDCAIRGNKRRRLERAMDEIEAALEDEESYLESNQSDPGTTDPETADPEQSPTTPAMPTASDEELEQIRTNLASTVEAMRLRQQEQRHLHQLAIEKLEAVAQRCLQQERALREFSEEIAYLREQNRHLDQQLETATNRLNQSQLESARKDLAINAMSSAVAGLEGWINNSSTPNRTPRRIVTRGRGRFRGRYYAEEQMDVPAWSGGSDARLHDGVTAWVRGFRDVEEELKSSQGNLKARLEEGKIRLDDGGDDWGEFESASGV